MRGFFAPSTLVSTRQTGTRVPLCGSCGLYKKCKSPKLPVVGKGRKKILVVSEAPGKDEDSRGRQLVGEAAAYLRQEFERADISLDNDCWMTSALICHSKEAPTGDQIDYCRPNLLNTIEALQPEVIVLFGHAAVSSCIGGIWKDDIGPLSKWVGWQIPSQKLNAWICPLYHPSFFLRVERTDGIPEKMFRQQLKAVGKLNGRPWEEIPDYAAQVECIEDTDKAARIIRKFIKAGGWTAFDYENDRIKPDRPMGRIVCASICHRGERTISFPWHGEAETAAIEYLRSPLPKIASNMKHEHRWTFRKYGFRVRNWKWDTMVAAHVLDNRRGITGLKFQSFVTLGADSYNDHIEQFLKASGKKESNNQQNNIRDIDMQQLLKYNALDSVLEYFLAMRQIEQMYGKDAEDFLEC